MAYKTWAEIDLDALRRNYRAVRSRTNARVICVVKANAYGHGVEIVVPALIAEGCDFFAVSCTAEAVELRRLAPLAEILILGYSVPEDVETLIRLNILQTVCDAEAAQAYCDAVKACWAAGTIPPEARLRVHAKLDTGMNRIGFDTYDPAACAASVAAVGAEEALSLEGMFTHFACADTDGAGGMTARQLARFRAVEAELGRMGRRPAICHVSNSAGILCGTDAGTEAVRAGIILYGLAPDGGALPGFSPVMRLCTRIAHIHRLRAGESVSYGATWTAEADTRIATLPIGYGDGFLRRYGGLRVRLADGYEAPIVGRICMDQCMIDLGDHPAEVGDEVTLFGGDAMSADALAEMVGTIGYEVTTAVAHRVPRVGRGDFAPAGATKATRLGWPRDKSLDPSAAYAASDN